ncbi:Tm-1-like ATP-binding domain-containing protein [Rubrobacter naiadicus]|uniref:Tm-1-like ATP-binding domain-containing protein n=1 Tax=Rubrobacter naiadicus TaxID=1392641 RepID=UPI00235EBB36|nr:Tm-1-like ATP-binding domain-containing protein [Rubrobacter naiadicus]
MGSRSIAVLATLDTKMEEATYLKRAIEKLGMPAMVFDVGLGGGPHGLASVSAEEVANSGGSSVTELRSSHPRDSAMRIMGEGAGRLLKARHEQGALAGTIGVGGNQGTAIASIAMRMLPIGVPKLIISTVASGNVRAYVGECDIAMMFSVGDLLGGPNPVTANILAKGAAAIVGMARAEAPSDQAQTSNLIAITAFGNTHRAVLLAMQRLAEAGWRVVPFHASGACGSAMERLVEEGAFEGVLDLTIHELLGELYPEDIYAPVRQGRLTAAGRLGIPQVVVPGGLEYFCFGAPQTVPRELRARPTHYHNPYNTNVRTSYEELYRVGTVLADRLNSARGPVAVLIPVLGWSEVGSPGGVLHDPRANAGFVEALRKHLDPKITLQEVKASINEPAFAKRAADVLLAFLDCKSAKLLATSAVPARGTTGKSKK